jgi:urea transport system substrate-binding protein
MVSKKLFSPLILSLGLSAYSVAGFAQDTIKVGVLHSLSGTMAISETTLKDTVLMMIEQQNAKGGLLGKQLEPVVVDPASDWPLFAERTRELLSQEQVAVIFGCWTSVSRKAVLPVVEELNGLLFYPVQYEGEESSRNIFYTGAAPNQQAIPAVDYLMEELEIERWVLLGTDYVYPRTTNLILEAYLKDHGVDSADIMINYTPFSHSDWQSIVSEVRRFGSQGKPTAVISTINGDANVPFYRELSNQGVSAEDIPVIAFSVGEEELSGIDTGPLVGHMAAWNYFQSVETPENEAFIEQWQDFIGSEERVTNDPMEATYIGFNMWVQAVEAAGTTGVDAVSNALIGATVPNLTGGVAVMGKNHHLSKPVLIGEIQDDGQFEVVWETDGLVEGDAWSDFLPESRDIIADWTAPILCGNYNTVTGECSGQSY